MNKGELIDAISKDAGVSACRYFDPETGRGLSRDDDVVCGQDYNGTRGNRCSTLNSRMAGGDLPGGAVISAAVSSTFTPPGGGGKAQDHNSSRSSNKAYSWFDPGGGTSGDGIGWCNESTPTRRESGGGSGGRVLEQSRSRTGRNPQTGKEIKIAAKKVAKFKAGKALADVVK